jgi:hypothetical protein
MTVTEHPSEIIVCHIHTARGDRKRSGSRALSISVCKKSKLTFILFSFGQLAQNYQCVDYVRD